MAESGWQRGLQAGTQENVQMIYVGYLLSVGAPIGVVMAYINRADAQGWARDHYTFLIRTFWIGALYGIVGLALSLFLIGVPLLVLATLWWIVRCVQGLRYASKQQPIPTPGSWFLAG